MLLETDLHQSVSENGDVAQRDLNTARLLKCLEDLAFLVKNGDAL